MYINLILKLTNLLIADTTNGVWFKTFHLYRGFFRKFTKVGFVIRGSVRKIKAPTLTYKSIKYKSLKVGFSRRMLIIASNNKYKLKNDFNYKICGNYGIIFGKRKNIKGNSISGIMTTQVQQRKYLIKASLLI